MSTNKIKAGVIGLGLRGTDMIKLLAEMPEFELVWACDTAIDKAESAAATLEEKYGIPLRITANHREVLQDPAVEAVFIFAAWESHVPLAVDAMQAGKAVALEVGGAYTVEDCWRLVNTWEQTRVPFMFLENCCFGKRETMVLNMVRKGLFGEIVHCKGGYRHDLRSEVANGKELRHYRLRNYLTRNCENYPTHELGPIAKVLNINRGNRMLTLNAISSKAVGLQEYVKTHKPEDAQLKNARFAQGDVVNTLITCADGSTVLLTLDTTLPRSYSRDFSVHGTKGMYSEESDSVFIDGESREFWEAEGTWGTAKSYEKHLVPTWKKTLEEGTVGSHGGMDWLELHAFAECLQQGKPMPIDVYDAAAWMVITPLSEMSIAMGGAPVAIPDFTSGAWMHRPILDVLELD